MLITLGTGIGSALFLDEYWPNTEFGHLPLHHGDAEDWAAASVREHDDLSWKGRRGWSAISSSSSACCGRACSSSAAA